jgi:hypothetical protein
MVESSLKLAKAREARRAVLLNTRGAFHFSLMKELDEEVSSSS